MASYEQIGTDEDVKGFLVNFGYWNTYYVQKRDLLISDTCIMFKTENYLKKQMYEDDKDFSWGESYSGVKIIKIDYQVSIKAIYEIPEWVLRNKEQSEEKIEEYKKEKRRNGFIRKMFRIILVGKN